MAFNENALILLHHFFRAMVTLGKYLQAKDKKPAKVMQFPVAYLFCMGVSGSSLHFYTSPASWVRALFIYP